MSSRRRSGRSTNLVVPLYTAHRLGELPQKRYDRVKVIGEGVAGVLYFVKEVGTKRLGAAKLIKLAGLDYQDIEFLEREIAIHKQLHHYAITSFRRLEFVYSEITKDEQALRVREAFSIWDQLGPRAAKQASLGMDAPLPTHIAIIMEYADGGDLLGVMEAYRTLREDTALFLFRQIADGLAYLHSQDICHRDLKLENTLIFGRAAPGAQPRIKLTDFGFCKSETYHSAPNTRLGSIPYMPPEVYNNTTSYPYDGKAADIWSLGVLLYVMLCGQYPFLQPEDRSELSDANRLRNLERGRFNLPDGLQDSLHDLLQRMMDPIPGNRPTISEVMHHPWYCNVSILPPRLRTISHEAEDEEAVGNIVVTMQSAEETRNTMMEFRRLIEKMREWNDASSAPQNLGPIHPHIQMPTDPRSFQQNLAMHAKFSDLHTA